MYCRTQTAIKGPFILQRTTSIIKTFTIANYMQRMQHFLACEIYFNVLQQSSYIFFSVILPQSSSDLDSVTNVCGWKNPSILLTVQHLNHRLQNYKLLRQLTMSCQSVELLVVYFWSSLTSSTYFKYGFTHILK